MFIPFLYLLYSFYTVPSMFSDTVIIEKHKMGVKSGLLATLVLLANLRQSSALREMVCSTTRHQAIIQPDADAFIAGFFAMHNSGNNGVGCGSINTMGEYSFSLDGLLQLDTIDLLQLNFADLLQLNFAHLS